MPNAHAARLQQAERQLAEATRKGCAVCRAWPRIVTPTDPNPWEANGYRCPHCGRDGRDGIGPAVLVDSLP